jgi:hypothetical protein
MAIDFAAGMTVVAAWVGALGTFWQIFTRSTPMHKVRINLEIVYLTGNDGGILDRLIRVTVLNRGREAVDVSSWAIREPSGGQFLQARPHPLSTRLPKRLEAGSSIHFFCDVASIVQVLNDQQITDQRVRAEVRLATGKTIRARKRISL